MARRSRRQENPTPKVSRARARDRAGDVIDAEVVEAEVVDATPPPIVVTVKHPPRVTEEERAALARAQGVANNAEVTIARVRAIVKTAEEAAAVGEAIGGLLSRLFR